MSDFDKTMVALGHMRVGLRCATRIIELPDNPRLGITMGSKLDAVSDVLRVAGARADGGDDTCSAATMKVMGVVLADVELRLLWDKLGLKEWSPK